MRNLSRDCACMVFMPGKSSKNMMTGTLFMVVGFTAQYGHGAVNLFDKEQAYHWCEKVILESDTFSRANL